MTKFSIIVLLTAIFFVSCSDSYLSTSVVDNANFSTISEDNIYYFLPEKKLDLIFTTETVETKPSRLQTESPDEFEMAMKDLNNKLFKTYKKETIVSVKDISISEVVSPNYDRAFVLSLPKKKRLEIFKKIDYKITKNELGVLSDTKVSIQNHSVDFLVNTAKSLLQYYFKIPADQSEGEEDPLNTLYVKTTTENIVTYINKLEERKKNILLNISKIDRKNLNSELKAIKTELDANYSLLRGTKTNPKQGKKLVQFDPKKPTKEFSIGKDKYEFVFSSKMINTKISKALVGAASSNKDKKGLAYVNPAYTILEIYKVIGSDKVLAKKHTTAIPQLGSIAYLPYKTDLHLSESIKLDPKSGALLSYSTTESSISDSSSLAKFGGDIIDSIEKKKTSSPNPYADIDKQIADKEREFRLLELQTKIDSLTNLNINN